MVVSTSSANHRNISVGVGVGVGTMAVAAVVECNSIKDTVHVETDQNFEIDISAEYKYTLNELLVKKIFFNTSNSLRDMTNESVYRKY